MERHEKTIGQYRIGRRVAVGGMAEVFEARRVDDQTGQRWPLVLKVMLPDEDRGPEMTRMFIDEGRLAVALRHPSLVRVDEVGEVDDECFIAMERVDGLSLAQLLKRRGALPVNVALIVVGRLLAALEYLHGRSDEEGRPLQIVHRDVTPGNILVSRAGEVKLGDFGIARSRLHQVRTRTGVIKGTVQYMAPEQVTDSGTDARTDLYQVGLVLFEMLVGRRLIDAEREVELLRMAEDPPRTSLLSVRPELDAALERLLDPALERFPEERYGSAAVFSRALQRTAAELEVSLDDNQPVAELVAAEMPESRTMPAVDEPARPPPPAQTPRAFPYAAVLIAVAGVVGGAAYLLWPERPATSPPDAAVVAARDSAPPPRTDVAVEGASPDIRPDLVSDKAPLPDKKRRPVRIRPPKRDARVSAPARRPDANSSGAAPARQRCRQRLATTRAALSARGILASDLPATLRARLKVACSGAAAIDATALADIEAKLGALDVDRGFIKAKLSRVDARLRALPASRSDRKSLRDRAGLALQAFLDGNYDRANRQLNRIISLLK